MPKTPAPAAEPAPRHFASARSWEAWLARQHAKSDGLWLRIAKTGSDARSVTYAEALEVALCWGWIDGQKKALDDTHWLQRFTPRHARSIWSKVNREKALALVTAGRMQPAGQAEIDRAQADGRWEQAYDSAKTATVPADLQAALDAAPSARAFFKTLDAANRYAVLWRVQTAKKAETRARRIAQFVQMLARGEKIHGPGKKALPPSSS